MPAAPSPLLIDLFCRVVDNFGDIGVCWRLSRDLATRGHTVRLWVDDASALAWMAPDGCKGVTVLAWDDRIGETCRELPRADVWIEAFGCEIASEFIANYVQKSPTCSPKSHQNGLKGLIWLNLEYLSAEAYVARSHGLPSPVLSGPAAGLATKWFFYPGFTADTGGLIRERNVIEDAVEPDASHLRVNLFCYEPPGLSAALAAWADGDETVEIRCATGRSWQALQTALSHITSSKNSNTSAPNGPGMLQINEHPTTDQDSFDHWLRGATLNCVRGEDSLVRALWAGRALLWNIYPQDDGAHIPKLEAFLDWLQAPPSMRHAHRVWNGILPADRWVAPTRGQLADWQAAVCCARQGLTKQTDLSTRLLAFIVQKQRSSSAAAD